MAGLTMLVAGGGLRVRVRVEADCSCLRGAAEGQAGCRGGRLGLGVLMKVAAVWQAGAGCALELAVRDGQARAGLGTLSAPAFRSLLLSRLRHTP